MPGGASLAQAYGCTAQRQRAKTQCLAALRLRRPTGVQRSASRQKHNAWRRFACTGLQVYSAAPPGKNIMPGGASLAQAYGCTAQRHPVKI
ncbi:hypothetical protein CHU32_02830 [Superficieibacter electus]|uniref:Uncharacterized protein n=1 Tax=Superficieibacter electus TaxID=2022662 RepID=A0A2P5GUY9_9ENTR|nr:hypothetical protein CHU33_12940 [Superficieibacter electus]POP50377.1 hypothetical protein CHU32_02830 [Superficieibacter electus]